MATVQAVAMEAEIAQPDRIQEEVVFRKTP